MVQILSWAKAARLRNMKIKKLIDNPTFKHYFYYVTLVLATYSIVTDSFFLSKLVLWTQPCLAFKNKPLVNAAIPWLQDANIARWETTNTSVVGLQPFNSPDMNTTVYALGGLSIKRGSYSGDFEWDSSYISTNPDYISYAGVVGSVIPLGANTSFPLITLVAVVDSHTTSYLIIREGDTNPAPVFSFTSILPASSTVDSTADAGFVSQHYSYSTKGTYSIRPGLRVYVCQHFDNPTHSYNWARKFGAAVGIFIIVLELLKVLVIFTSSFYLLGFKQPGIVNFSNYSPLWIWALLKFPASHVVLRSAMNLEETNSLQLLGDTFLHSLPMLVLTIQSLVYRSNQMDQPPPSPFCLALVSIPKQVQELKEELSQHLDAHPQDERQKRSVFIFAMIDCAFNLLPLDFMISLAVQEFNSVFVFIVPLLIGLAKLLICVSIFWTSRFRKPLASPLMFSFALNSPILLLCTISSPVRQLATITAASGVTAWASWPFDFVAIDLPILVTLIILKGFHYGNDQDVALLEQNLVLVILAIVFLVWRTVSGICVHGLRLATPTTKSYGLCYHVAQDLDGARFGYLPLFRSHRFLSAIGFVLWPLFHANRCAISQLAFPGAFLHLPWPTLPNQNHHRRKTPCILIASVEAARRGADLFASFHMTGIRVLIQAIWSRQRI
ncbi:hypothetical protein BC938DRAFT_475799 [Jimgerdemannia flammicorona]|uniref:Uncharacterized protein n=1 Tax=Jimgerdemannia flammicorona TaxID=994334 RepID=A0A433QR96_9FUNG|nr:hypothetical protein BC938DRAFT_475799 [Jimgerdemannia flammicorona]